MTKKPEDLLKCRFCPSTFLKWRTGKNGVKIDGFSSLKSHLYFSHQAEYEKIELFSGMGELDEKGR
jgi:hypothetical protein